VNSTQRKSQIVDLGTMRSGDAWSQCNACGSWVREVTTIEEREDRPPESEISPGFAALLKLGILKARLDEESGFDRDELEICKRRGHDVISLLMAWEQCKHWVRENLTIEEREDAPSEHS
jgi:hypothetical protein